MIDDDSEDFALLKKAAPESLQLYHAPSIDYARKLILSQGIEFDLVVLDLVLNETSGLDETWRAWESVGSDLPCPPRS